MKILHFDELDSTNLYAKAHVPEGQDLIVIAKRQTGGRGTKGRSFSSAEGGIYMTRLTFYDSLPAKDAFRILASVSVGVCRTLEKFSISPVIKWPNDIFVQDRKICGISIENTFSGKNVCYSVVGVGLNVNNPLPEDLKDIAVSMKELAGKELDRDEVEKTLIEETGSSFAFREYRGYVGYLNREIRLIENGKETRVIAKDVDEDGSLIVEEKGICRRVHAAEVSVRI